MDLLHRDRETSAATLRELELNNPAIKILAVHANSNHGIRESGTHFYYPTGAADLSRLGAALANSTKLRTLAFRGDAALAEMAAGNTEFWGGLDKNTSIIHLGFFRCNLQGEFEYEIMNRMASKNLEDLGFIGCEVDTRSVNALASVLSRCTNLTAIGLQHGNIDDGLLGEFMMRLRGFHQLGYLDLRGNNFGITGSEAIATLLQDPESRLIWLNLSGNPRIDDDCARILANSLEGNSTLEELNLSYCPVTASGLDSAFSKILCNPSTVNKTYLSNHTLQRIGYHPDLPTNLSSLLGLKPIDKILRAHFNLDMTKILEWDQKLLPRVLLWLDRARQCSTAGSHNVEAKCLSIIYQFVRAFPMAAVPPTMNELKDITRHHGLRVVESNDGYVVGDRVYTDRPSAGPWGYVVGHTRSSVFVTMNHTNIGAEIVTRKNRTVWNAPMLFDEATLAARRQQKQLHELTLRHGLKQDWNEDGYAVGDRVHVNPFTRSGNCPKRHCGIWGYVVGHTRSSVWVATDHTSVDGEVLKRRSSSVSKTPVHR